MSEFWQDFFEIGGIVAAVFGYVVLSFIALAGNLKANALLKRVEFLENGEETWEKRYRELYTEQQYQNELREELADAFAKLPEEFQGYLAHVSNHVNAEIEMRIANHVNPDLLRRMDVAESQMQQVIHKLRQIPIPGVEE